jgi:hypothetical protein
MGVALTVPRSVHYARESKSMSSESWFKFIDELEQMDADFLQEMKERF